MSTMVSVSSFLSMAEASLTEILDRIHHFIISNPFNKQYATVMQSIFSGGKNGKRSLVAKPNMGGC
jgi:hypothetical protein